MVLNIAKRPVLIAGGGARYSGAEQELLEFSERFGVPVVETFAGKTVTPDTELLLGGLRHR